MNRNSLQSTLVTPWCLLVATTMLATSANAAELRVLSWGEYMQPALVAAFEEAHGASVVLTAFDSDDGRNEVLAASRGRGFDLLMVNESSVESYARRGWLGSFTAAQVPNSVHIPERWTAATPGAAGRCLAYFWGGVGIAYRSDLVGDPPPRSWMDLMRPRPEWKGKVLMAKDGTEMLDVALRASGNSLATADREALGVAEKLLVQQSESVLSYDYSALDETATLVTGEAVIGWLYAGDSAALTELEPAIKFVYPEEGINLWTDYWCMADDALQPDLARAFLDFINDPQRAADNAEDIAFATPNAAALELLPDEVRDNPAIFPPQDVLARAVVAQRPSARIRKQINQIRAKVLR